MSLTDNLFYTRSFLKVCLHKNLCCFIRWPDTRIFVMNWTKSSILSFLRLYKGHPCIWHPKHTLNKDRLSVNEAWADIQDSMPIPCTIPQLKKKKESLMSAYRRYKTQVRTSLNENGEPTYKPTWFAYKTMDSFLSSVYLPKNEGDEETTAVEEIDVKPDVSITTLENDETDEIETECDEDEASPPKRPKKGRYDSFTIDQRELDEIEVMTRIWGRKLRKIPQERRDFLIYKINNLIYTDYMPQNVNGGFPEESAMEKVFVDHGNEFD